jgi:hypothetical protein
MRTTLAAIAILTLSACADSPEVMDWETYKERATRVYEGEVSYVIEGDQWATLEELADDYYRRVQAAELAEQGLGVETSESTVNRVNGQDDKWSTSARQNLTYCVSNTFGSNKQRMVNEMAAATAAWESVANVNFIYVPSADSNCRRQNSAVRIPVRPWSSGGACAFFPSGGGCVTRTLVINISDLDNNYAPVTTLGVLKHELGHVLGLRHEHIRSSNPTCAEGGSWRTLTAYDRQSVMHYPWCPEATNTGDLQITSLDASGAAQLYP